ncbi:MAG TPA: DUF1801 domain-containing protein [Candidatus Dormibacteraeota bacterium]|nr:DUF1801 domain-containing protein [Candidatus Dormibacteraeota bacterium]
MPKPKPKTVDEYIAASPARLRPTLNRPRKVIRAAAPKATEVIGYGMAGYKYKGKPVVYFAHWKDHVALYGSFVNEYAQELKAFTLLKGTVRFPPEKPPSDRLLTKIIKSRVAAIDAGE